MWDAPRRAGGFWGNPRRTGSLPVQAMPGAPEDVNPLQDLDFGDEPLAPKAPAAPPPAKRAPPTPQQAAPPGPPPPPPLPRRSSGNKPAAGGSPQGPQANVGAGGVAPVAQIPAPAPRPPRGPAPEA